MATWSPDPAGLAQILQTLRDSTNIHDKHIQSQITMRLNDYQRVPNYIAYLAHILAAMTAEGEQIRSIAGYILKNNARLITSASPDAAVYVKASTISAFTDASVMIRNAAQQVLITLLGVLEPRNWPEALSVLIQALDSPDQVTQEGAFVVLSRACEDYPRKFDVEIQGSRPLDFLVPKWIELCQHPSPKIRGYAISCLTQFVPIETESLNVHIDNIISSFFRTAADTDPIVRRNVCTGLVLLLASRPDKLIPEMHNVAEYMLYSTQDQNTLVSLEACEFWLTFAEDPELQNALTPYIPRVAPVLLDSMVYSEEEILMNPDAEEDDNANVPDKGEDMKPRHYSGRTHGLEREEKSDAANGQPAGSGADDEDDDYDEDYDDDEDMSTEWNLRKCAAAALDVLAVRFGNTLLQPLLPHLKEKLWSPDWVQRECGILALGALAEGCIDYMEPHLPTLIPFLVNMLADSKPLIRSITCWTLGRYAGWYAQPQTQEQRDRFFIPIMEGLLRMILDNNKRVQEAGCSAFATFEEEAAHNLIPYLEPVLQNLVLAFDKYQQKIS
ncbi:related to importin beta-2 subunit (transportin) [Serendipita indica DSM 11827]|uniref:Related to importin beta-2 subunit (Transportin) n=1 Tax=Serendipita indica (strain DSM 11827) TaxID=1109443 RepID=G4TGR5_SERID|nr:related to importin beta-2 subunit (transportin) [Serendipita indica DSM 11827]